MKNNLLVKNEKSSLLESCKVVSEKTVLLKDDKTKNLLPAFFEGFEPKVCQPGHPEERLVNGKWIKCKELVHDANFLDVNFKNKSEKAANFRCLLKYDYDELLSVKAQEKNDTRHHVETFEDKCMSIAKEGLDMDLANTLYKVIFKAIKQRRLMLFNLEGSIGLLNNAYDCHFKGVNCHSSNLAIKSKLDELVNLLSNPEVKDWLKYNPSDMNFDTGDYIATYTKALRQLTEIRDMPFEDLKEAIHNDEDPFEDNILANEAFEEESLYESSDSDDLNDIICNNLD